MNVRATAQIVLELRTGGNTQLSYEAAERLAELDAEVARLNAVVDELMEL